MSMTDPIIPTTTAGQPVYLTEHGPVPIKCATASAPPPEPAAVTLGPGLTIGPDTKLAPEGFERLLTPEEVADILNVQKSWVYRAARNGTIPSINVGRWVRFERDAVEAFIAKGGAGDE